MSVEQNRLKTHWDTKVRLFLFKTKNNFAQNETYISEKKLHVFSYF